MFGQDGMCSMILEHVRTYSCVFEHLPPPYHSPCLSVLDDIRALADFGTFSQGAMIQDHVFVFYYCVQTPPEEHLPDDDTRGCVILRLCGLFISFKRFRRANKNLDDMRGCLAFLPFMGSSLSWVLAVYSLNHLEETETVFCSFNRKGDHAW